MGVAPAKIISVVIVSFEVALVSSPNIYYNCYFKKLTNKCKEKIVILKSIGIIEISHLHLQIFQWTCLAYPYNSANGLND